MNPEYSQWKAMMAITKASLRSILRSPSAIIFSIAFPLIFIMVFGLLGSGGRVNIKIAVSAGSDTANAVYDVLRQSPGITIVRKDSLDTWDDLSKGRLTAVLGIHRNPADSTPAYRIDLTSSESVNPQNLQVLQSLLSSLVRSIDEKDRPVQPAYAVINQDIRQVPGRTYRTIDFILPGQLGFSLLSAGVFGVAFVFFNLRQTLVLKRFFATPVSKTHIVFGEGLSRVIFQMMTAVIILTVGHFLFRFTLVNGWLTFLELLVLSFVGLIVFMGFGFIVSGLARSESSIPPFANLVTLPQFLLAGTFFPIDNFPKWLQPLCRILPLTHLNDAMRNVAFEGAHLAQCWPQLLVLAVWAIVAYAVAVKVFRWD